MKRVRDEEKEKSRKCRRKRKDILQALPGVSRVCAPALVGDTEAQLPTPRKPGVQPLSPAGPINN